MRRRLDVHHVVKRSQGGSDFDLDLLVALCRWCHDHTDAPYERGRLVVTALGAGQFTFEVVRRTSHGTPQARVPGPRGQKPRPSTIAVARLRSGKCRLPTWANETDARSRVTTNGRALRYPVGFDCLSNMSLLARARDDVRPWPAFFGRAKLTMAAERRYRARYRRTASISRTVTESLLLGRLE